MSAIRSSPCPHHVHAAALQLVHAWQSVGSWFVHGNQMLAAGVSIAELISCYKLAVLLMHFPAQQHPLHECESASDTGLYRYLAEALPLFHCRYAAYYLTRNSLTYTAPVMVADPALKMDISQVRAPAPTPAAGCGCPTLEQQQHAPHTSSWCYSHQIYCCSKHS